MSTSDEVRIEVALTATDEVRALIGELEDVLCGWNIRRSSVMEFHSTRSSNRMSGSSSHDGKVVAVGCGGVALFPDYAEVKRMYVHHTARGQGVADAILDPHRSRKCVTPGFPCCVWRLVCARSQRCGSTSEPGFRECPGVRRLCAEAAGGHCGERVLREADVAWMGQGVALAITAAIQASVPGSPPTMARSVHH